MIDGSEPKSRAAIATLLVSVCMVAFGPPRDLTAADGDKVASSRPTDIVLQPGIVDEIPPPWRGRWQLFNGFDARSPIGAAASFSGIWNDNVLITAKSPVADFVFEIDPSLWFESSDLDDRMRNYLKIGYDPQILRYEKLNNLDATNHRWFAQYLYRGTGITGRIDHRYAEFSDVSRVRDSGFTPGGALEADTITSEENDSSQRDLTDAERDLGRSIQGTWQVTSAYAVIDLSGLTTFRPAAKRRFQDIDRIDGVQEFEEWWVEGILYRESSRRLSLGLGPRFGWAEFSRAPGQNYQQGLAYLRYRYSSTIRLDASTGVDRREYGRRNEQETTPLFLVRTTWVPSSRTAVSIEGFQTARASFQGDAATDLGGRLVLSQHLFDRFEYNLRCGYVSTEFATGQDSEASRGRDDDFLFIRNSLDYGLGDIGSISVFHEVRDSGSNRRPDYEQRLTGVSLSFEF